MKKLNLPRGSSVQTLEGETLELSCAIYRGGTSKAIFLKAEDLPEDKLLADAIILCLFGSPDPRQVDGLGGADPLTSKLAIVSPSERSESDIEFTFGQVSLRDPHVDYRGTCGNISSAVGYFAINMGWVSPVEPLTRVRIWNTNSQRILIADIPVKDGRSAVSGNYSIAGVPGQGPCVRLDFGDVSGTVTGSLLPTRQVMDTLLVEGVGNVQVSIVDAGSLCVLIDASSLGIPANSTPQMLRDHAAWLDLLEMIRGEVAYQLGLASKPSKAAEESASVPKLLLVGAAQAYVDSENRDVAPDAFDILGRALTNQKPHQAYQVTGALGTAAAAQIPGTIVNQILSGNIADTMRIGHPGGVMRVNVSLAKQNDEWHLSRAVVELTAREIMRGKAFLPWNNVLSLYERLQRRTT